MIKDKWVRIMFDYSATAIWNSDGKNCEYNELPISDRLVLELDKWTTASDWYASYYLHRHFSNGQQETPEELDSSSFTDWGFQLAQEVKKELPDWTVIYHGEDSKEYEIK